MGTSEADESNFAAFRDCLFEAIVSRSTPSKARNKRSTKGRSVPTSKSTQSVASSHVTKEDESTDLADFSDFMAGETFPSLPSELRSLSHRNLQENQDLAEKWSLPLSLSVFEELAEIIDPAVTDSLTAYGLIEPPKTDLQSFIAPVVTSYISAVTISPPKWIATRVTACEICERDWVPMTYHHLIPREVHAKVLKRGWHEEHMLNSVAWLCRACHTFVHNMASNEELAKEWFTVEKICSRDDTQKWAQWVGKVRWKKR